MKRSLAATAAAVLVLSSCQEPIQPTTPGLAAVDAPFANALYWDRPTDMQMPARRALFGATTGRDGRIYVAGGFLGDNYLSTADVYDPTTRTWAPIADMPARLYDNKLVLNDDGLIYALGGYDIDRGGYGAVFSYDPSRNAWSSLNRRNMPPYAANAAIGGRLYSLGGLSLNGSGATPEAWAFDPQARVWFEIRKLERPRYFGAAAALDGKLYVTGGTDGFNEMAEGAVYDPQTDIWTPIAPMLHRRMIHRLEPGPDGLLYAMGGTYDMSVEAYDPRTNRWTEKPRMLSVRQYFATATLPNGIVALGGCDGSQAGYDAEVCGYLSTTLVEVLVAETNRAPTAVIGGPYSGKVGIAVQFNASASSDPDGDALRFDWNFDDGTTLGAGGPTPTHIFEAPGTYNVHVTVGDPSGLTSSASIDVVIEPLTPEEAAGELEDAIAELLASGGITVTVAGQLAPSIEAAAASLARDNPTAASGQLNAFINKALAAIKAGKLNAETGNALIDTAKKILASLP